MEAAERKWSVCAIDDNPPLKKQNTLTETTMRETEMGIQMSSTQKMMLMTMNSSAPTKDSQTTSSVGDTTMRSMSMNEGN